MALEKRKDDLREEVARTGNKKKSTAKWCKGKIGVEHVTELVVNHNISWRKACKWYPLYFSYDRRDEGPKEWRYTCLHSYRCINCGKYTEYFLKNVEECPNYTPKPE